MDILPCVITNKTKQRIEALMRELCGLGISNQWTPPAMFTACIGIAMCKYIILHP